MIQFRTTRRLILSLIVGTAVIGALVVQPDTARAIDFKPEVKIPGLFEGTVPVDNELLGNYLRAIFVYFIWAVGVIAVSMMTLAGVKWVAAAGDAARIKDARDMINSAIIGVIIALTSVVLLNLISPQFTIFKIPDLQEAASSRLLNGAVTKVCPAVHNTACGQFKEIGKIKVNPTTGRIDSNGKEVNEYCIGTTCPRGGVAGLGENVRVCSLDINQQGFYVSAGGCVQSFDYDPNGAPEPLSEDNNIAVHQGYQSFGNIVQLRQKCGFLIRTITSGFRRYEAGGWCDGVGITFLSSANPQCYLLGAVGKLYDKPQPQVDVVTNLCCPGSPCPSRDK